MANKNEMEVIEPKYVRFDKDMSSIVKGFAIIFMMFLHCYDDYKYEVPLNFDHAYMFLHDGFVVCVGIYAFMIGFGYAFSLTKDLRYGWQHIKKLMIPYLIIFFVFILPTCYHEFFASGWKMMLYTLLGLDVRFFYYNWFIYVFIFAMLVLPYFTRFIDKNPLSNTLISVAGVYVTQVLFHFLVYPRIDTHFQYMFFNCFTLTMVYLLGYLFAHEHYYERIPIDKISKPVALVLSLSVLLLVQFLESRYRIRAGFMFDFFYAPLAIGAIVLIFSKFELKHLRRAMIKLGWASMYMWFLQALFHTPIVRTVYQPIITIFSDINLVVIWTIVVLFFASWILKTIVDYLLALPKRLSAAK